MTTNETTETGAQQHSNGDLGREWSIGTETFLGIGSFHKTLVHDSLGQVDRAAFNQLQAAILARVPQDCASTTGAFSQVPPSDGSVAALTNPQAGLGSDRLLHRPDAYSMPPAPKVDSGTTAAEMVELYWMALLRDLPFTAFDAGVDAAIQDINAAFGRAKDFIPGVDLPGGGAHIPFTANTLFRFGLPGEDIGPMVSQFFVRPAYFGTQVIDARQWPYAAGRDYLTDFDTWLAVQDFGRDAAGQAYPQSNEDRAENYEPETRYISTMRDLARFVNKDALHQAYFNAALILLSGGAKWTQGNPYEGGIFPREAGFGVLGGPHLLSLVSEVATRALKVVWFQKWQVHLRLRPEAYGGLVHVQEQGINNARRAFGLPAWLKDTAAATAIFEKYGTYLLPIAFTAGSPTHPAYGAGHATVAGACVTILKAYFATITKEKDGYKPIKFNTLLEREEPYGRKPSIRSYITGHIHQAWGRYPLAAGIADELTIEGELNKLAQNVAMGRSMGGVHWRTDNSRSLMLGEALAAEILAGITCDAAERPVFLFRTFARKEDGQPKIVRIAGGKVYVDDNEMTLPISAL